MSLSDDEINFISTGSEMSSEYIQFEYDDEDDEWLIVGDSFEEYRKKYIGNIFQNFNLINSYALPPICTS